MAEVIVQTINCRQTPDPPFTEWPYNPDFIDCDFGEIGTIFNYEWEAGGVVVTGRARTDIAGQLELNVPVSSRLTVSYDRGNRRFLPLVPELEFAVLPSGTSRAPYVFVAEQSFDFIKINCEDPPAEIDEVALVALFVLTPTFPEGCTAPPTPVTFTVSDSFYGEPRVVAEATTDARGRIQVFVPELDANGTATVLELDEDETGALPYVPVQDPATFESETERAVLVNVLPTPTPTVPAPQNLANCSADARCLAFTILECDGDPGAVDPRLLWYAAVDRHDNPWYYLASPPQATCAFDERTFETVTYTFQVLPWDAGGEPDWGAFLGGGTLGDRFFVDLANDPAWLPLNEPWTGTGSSCEPGSPTLCFVTLVHLPAAAAPPATSPLGCDSARSGSTAGWYTGVSCGGFAPGETVNVYWDETTGAPIATFTATWNGRVAGVVQVPEAPSGDHRLVAIGATSGTRQEASYAIEPSLTLSASSGTVGTNLTATLTGYGAAEAVQLRWYDTATASTVVATVTTSATGSAAVTFPVPSATAGSHRVEAIGAASGATASRDFAVAGRLRLSSTFGAVGANVTATLDGLPAGQAVELRWYDTATGYTAVASGVTSATGGAAIGFAVPEAVKGSHKVEAAHAGGVLSSFYLVAPSLSLSPATGGGGTSTAVTLRGYGAGEAVSVRWYDTASTSTVVATATTSAAGSATAAFDVPAATPGSHTVEGIVLPAGTRATAAFTVFGCALSPGSGAPGSFATASCYGFAAGETVTFRWGGPTGASLGTATASASGNATKTFIIPDAALGSYDVVATGGTSGKQAVAPFGVVPGVSLSTTGGWVGSAVTITLRGYAAGEQVRVRWDANTAAPVEVGTVTAGTDGRATLAYTIPPAVGGAHRIEGAGLGSGQVAGRDFTVWTRVRLAPTSGTVGASVTATLDGFKANEAVEIRWYDTTTTYTVVATLTASATGDGTVAFVVPPATKGLHKVEAVGAAGSTNAPFFIVNPSLGLSPGSGAVGTEVTVTLRGFAAGETVTVRWFDTLTASTVVGTATASASGGATVTFAVPSATAGGHKVEATGATSLGKASATFTVG